MPSRQPFVEAFVAAAKNQPGWEWDQYGKTGDDEVRDFIAPIEAFKAAFAQAYPTAEDTMDCQNNGPQLGTVLEEPMVRKVEGYIVTGRRDARVTLDGVYIDSDATIDPQSTVAQWIESADEDGIEGSLRRLWWD